MLLSVSVWSGADDATRDLFHWLSALIALPAIAYAGRPFFRSAVRSISAGALNMDVPISIGVLLAAAMSLYETATGGQHAYFDAAVSLLFFLLVGRFLDYRMRDVARSAAAKLMSLSARSAMRIAPDGSVAHVPIADIVPGDTVRVAAGERVPVDGVVTGGASDIDKSMLTGEAEPEPVRTGGQAFAGTLNLTGPLTLRVTAKAGDTLLAEIVRLMEAAEHSSGLYVRLADRVSRYYAPFVHIVALGTIIGWLLVGRRLAHGADHRGRRPDHHLPLRPRPGRAGRPGRRRRLPARPRHHGQGRRRARAPRGDRHCRFRQDRHAHARASRVWPAFRTPRWRRGRSRRRWGPIAVIRWPAPCPAPPAPRPRAN